MKNNVLAIVGLQWGDEGKGKIVDWLAREAGHVARFQGGHNAGHTLLYQGQKTVLHLIPSGIMQPAARCYIGNGVVVSPAAMVKEINSLQQAGIELKGRLFIADNASLIMPYHERIDCARESKNKIGTTKRGIGPAHEDKVGRRALRLYDLYNGSGREKFDANVEFYNYLLARHAQDIITDKEAAQQWDEIQKQAEQLQPYSCDDIGSRLVQRRQNGEKILLEGAQGAMLDIEQGTYPYTTSASCLAAAAAGGLGAELFPATVGVIKSYCTRVGNGPFPTEIAGAVGNTLRTEGCEFGSTTGRTRRVGWLDIPVLRHTIQINGCRQLVVTKLDVLDVLDEIKICTEYDIDGEKRQLPPHDVGSLMRCQPVYETLPGWEGGCSGVTEADKLPAAAQRYLQRIEQLCGIPVAVVSTGAEREMTLVRQPLF